MDKYDPRRDDLEEHSINGSWEEIERILECEGNSSDDQPTLSNCHASTFSLDEKDLTRAQELFNRKRLDADWDHVCSQHFIQFLIDNNYLIPLLSAKESETKTKGEDTSVKRGIPRKGCIVLYRSEPDIFIGNTFQEALKSVKGKNAIALITSSGELIDVYLKLRKWQEREGSWGNYKSYQLSATNVILPTNNKDGLIRVSGDDEQRQVKEFLSNVKEELKIPFETNITHSGRIYSEGNEKLLIKSKWGEGRVYTHPIWGVPWSYGLHVEYYEPIDSKVGKEHYQEYINFIEQNW